MERLRPRRTFQTTLSQPEVREASVECKLKLQRQGFNYCHSLWLALKAQKSGTRSYVRIEIWIKGKPTAVTLGRLKDYFSKYLPPYEYSIHSYDMRFDQITFVGGSNRIE